MIPVRWRSSLLLLALPGKPPNIGRHLSQMLWFHLISFLLFCIFFNPTEDILSKIRRIFCQTRLKSSGCILPLGESSFSQSSFCSSQKKEHDFLSIFPPSCPFHSLLYPPWMFHQSLGLFCVWNGWCQFFDVGVKTGPPSKEKKRSACESFVCDLMPLLKTSSQPPVHLKDRLILLTWEKASLDSIVLNRTAVKIRGTRS